MKTKTREEIYVEYEKPTTKFSKRMFKKVS